MKYLLLGQIYKLGDITQRFSHLFVAFLSCRTLKYCTDEQHNAIFSHIKSTLLKWVIRAPKCILAVPGGWLCKIHAASLTSRVTLP